ncbi:MAG: hypothetical protein IT372_24120 [Polyangiaceae bacterium]|nr:hypothetical protein [Polyangiaceae bacterium]
MRSLISPKIRLAPAALRRILVVSLTGTALAAIAAPGCIPDIGDQYCYPSSDVTDKDDRCPYGSPGGPKLTIKSCDATAAQPDCTAPPTFEQVFEILNDPALGGCSADGCHGRETDNAPWLPKDDPAEMHSRITSFSTPERGQYLNPATVGTPTDLSWMICNLQGIDSGGSPMPPQSGLADRNGGAEAIDTVLLWAACGAAPPAQ